jgi:hypothetical protein
MKRRLIFSTICLALSLPQARAGSLEPLPGAPAPSMKPLSDVEPRTAVQSLAGDATALYVIGQPGSYYLTGDITTADPDKSGIRIASNNVTLDLTGFAVIGPGKGVGTGSGILFQSFGAGIVVRNGMVRDWGQYGVQGTGYRSSHFEDLRLLSNGANGLLAYDEATVVRCTAAVNGAGGIATGSDSLITDSRASDNFGEGFGVTGTSTISHCVAANNGSIGLRLGSGSIDACVASGNQTGFSVGTVALSNCTASNNVTGIVSSGVAAISLCSVFGNSGDGIDAGSGSSVTRCTVVSNGGDGIEAANDCLLLENDASDNGSTSIAADIHLTGKRNRIERNRLGNSSTGNNDFGLSVDASQTGNLVVGNVSIGHKGSGGSPSANFSVPASGNVLATIVTDSTGLNSAGNALVNVSL